MPRAPGEPPALLRAWERLEPWKQVVAAFPVLALILFLVNLGPFGQPAGRSAVYAVLEGGAFTALLVVATASERARRPRS